MITPEVKLAVGQVWKSRNGGAWFVDKELDNGDFQARLADTSTHLPFYSNGKYPGLACEHMDLVELVRDAPKEEPQRLRDVRVGDVSPPDMSERQILKVFPPDGRNCPPISIGDSFIFEVDGNRISLAVERFLTDKVVVVSNSRVSYSMRVSPLWDDAKYTRVVKPEHDTDVSPEEKHMDDSHLLMCSCIILSNGKAKVLK